MDRRKAADIVFQDTRPPHSSAPSGWKRQVQIFVFISRIGIKCKPFLDQLTITKLFLLLAHSGTDMQ
jgi:hypothetical protein